jgi:hypothetical protein
MATEEDDPSPATVSAVPKPRSSTPTRRIIFLEDLPNINHSPTRLSFIAALDVLLKQSDHQNTPLVLMVSENIPRLEEWGAEAAGSTYRDRNDATLTVRNLLPNLVRRNHGFLHVE